MKLVQVIYERVVTQQGFDFPEEMWLDFLASEIPEDEREDIEAIDYEDEFYEWLSQKNDEGDERVQYLSVTTGVDGEYGPMRWYSSEQEVQ